jgi:hypothetical protein
MPFPETKCAACPCATGPCRAQAANHPRFCELVAAGEEGYIALLRAGPPATGTDPARAAILARRAKKMRVALGVKVPPGRH